MTTQQVQVLTLGVWLGTWAVVGLTGLIMVCTRRPDRWVRWHVRALLLPVLSALWALVVHRSAVSMGPWRSDGLGLAMGLYVAALGYIVQRFSVRYLHGDHRYGAYFGGITWTTLAASMVWMSRTLWLEAVAWTAMDVGLLLLIALARESQPVRAVAALTARRLAFSVAAVIAAACWCGLATGTADAATAMARVQMLPAADRMGISVLLVVAALAQAGGWPFGRWLLESAVTPTPVSAIMHAGLVNAGGLLLTRWAPVLGAAGPVPHALLLVFAWISVALGTGVLLVQVDYKRQLVASTMAQMGLMLMQCAIGAYDAAIVHLILHGVFKATLFLRSGFALPRPAQVLGAPGATENRVAPWPWLAGAVFALLYWWAVPQEPVRAMSALMLGAGLAITVRQVRGVREGRWAGLISVLVAAGVAEVVRMGVDAGLLRLLGWPNVPGVPGWGLVAAGLLAILALVWLAVSMAPSSRWAVRLYLGLVHIGDPRPDAMEPHPRSLAHYAKEAVLR